MCVGGVYVRVRVRRSRVRMRVLLSTAYVLLLNYCSMYVLKFLKYQIQVTSSWRAVAPESVFRENLQLSSSSTAQR